MLKMGMPLVPKIDLQSIGIAKQLAQKASGAMLLS